MTDLPMPVAVLDDDIDLAMAVARLLKRNGHDARPFTTPEALLAAMEETAWGCVVSDIQMSEMDGFAFAEVLRARNAGVALVFMTAWPATAHAVDAVRRYGGLDYLEKPLDEHRLLAAVAEGLEWSAQNRRSAQILGVLTKREREVFDLLTDGHSNKEVAERLGISARTVEDHRAAVVAKTRTNGLAQLVALSRGQAPSQSDNQG